MTTIINPFSQDNQSIPIKLKDGRELRLDVKQYAEDLVEYNQLQKNTDANSRNGSQTQQIELSGPLALYGKQKFNEKFPQEGERVTLSDEESNSIRGVKQEAERLDQIDRKNVENFAKECGFKIENNKSPTLETPEKIGEEDLKEATKLLRGILKSPEKSGTENSSNQKPRKGVGFGLNEVREYSPSAPPIAVRQSQSWRDRVNKSPDPQSPSR